MTRTRNAKRDANEPEIIKALEDYGCTVCQLSSSDALGIPDLLVSTPSGMLVLIEVKMPKKKLRASQQKFFDKFCNSPVAMVESAEDAIEYIKSEELHGNKDRT